MIRNGLDALILGLGPPKSPILGPKYLEIGAYMGKNAPQHYFLLLIWAFKRAIQS